MSTPAEVVRKIVAGEGELDEAQANPLAARTVAMVHAVPAGQHHLCVILDGVDADAVTRICAAVRAERLRAENARVLISHTAPREYPRNYTMGVLGELLSLGCRSTVPESGACECGAPANSPGGILCVKCDQRLINRT